MLCWLAFSNNPLTNSINLIFSDLKKQKLFSETYKCAFVLSSVSKIIHRDTHFLTKRYLGLKYSTLGTRHFIKNGVYWTSSSLRSRLNSLFQAYSYRQKTTLKAKQLLSSIKFCRNWNKNNALVFIIRSRNIFTVMCMNCNVRLWKLLMQNQL